METLREAFLEDPTNIYLILAAVEVAIAIFWHYQRSRKLAMCLLIPLVLAGGVFLLERVVVTERETIRAELDALAADIVQGRLDVAAKLLDEDFMGFKGSKEKLLQEGQATLQKYQIQGISFSHCEIKVNGRTADMDVTSMIDCGGQVSGRVPLRWKVYWIQRPEGWRIRDLSPPQMGFGGM